MEVQVEFVGYIKKHIKPEYHSFTILLSEGSKVRDILTAINVPENLPQSILVNGKQSSLETVLQDGNEVKLMPLICGG